MKIFGSRSWRTAERSEDCAQLTETYLNFLEALTLEAVSFCNRAVRLFPAPSRANAYGPHTGL